MKKNPLNTVKDIVAEAKKRLAEKPLTKQDKRTLASVLRAIADELEKVS